MSDGFNEDTVRKVAELARLELSVNEVKQFSLQLATVLKYVETLNEVDTSSVEPMTNALEVATRFNDDAPVAGPGASVMVESAAEHLYDNYKVPQVIGGGS